MEEQKPNVPTNEYQPTTPYPSLRKETSSNFFANRWVQIFGAILVGFVLFVSIVFFLNSRKETKSSSNEKQSASTSASVSNNQTQQQNDDQSKNYGYVNVDGLNLRAAPSTTAKILQTLPNTTRVEIVSTEGDWYLVEVTSRGYVSKQYVTKTKPANFLKVYSYDEFALKFLYPQDYSVKVDKGEPVTFNFTSNDSSGGFTVSKAASGSSVSAFLADKYPKATFGPCDITIGNGRDCRKVKTDEEDFYLVSAAGTVFKVGVLTNYVNFPKVLTAIIFPSFFFAS